MHRLTLTYVDRLAIGLKVEDGQCVIELLDKEKIQAIILYILYGYPEYFNTQP